MIVSHNRPYARLAAMSVRRIWPAALAAAGLLLLMAGTTHAVSRPRTNSPMPPERASPATSSGAIKHIVFIMEENRSFDNLFGRFPGADGAISATVVNGGHRTTIPLLPEPTYLWHDLGHDLSDAQISIDRGRMDGFSHETFADLFGDRAAFLQLMPDDVPNLYAYAHRYALSDRTFAPVPGPTFPSHLHMVAAQDGGVISNPVNSTDAWGCDSVNGATVLEQRSPGRLANVFPCFTYATLADALGRAGLSWSYYAAPPTDLGYMWSTLDAFKQIRQTPLWDTRVRDEHSFEADARSGRLPSFSWVTPRASESMHPPATVCAGENWVVSKINAVMRGPDWSTTLIVLAWDDWGGFYDHVAPPGSSTMVYGIRVPLLVISPFAKRGHISHTLYTFESVLKTAEVMWHIPALTAADRSAHTVLDNLDFRQVPQAPYVLPQRSCAPPLTRAQDRVYLDRALQHVLTSKLGLTMPQIAALHRTSTLAGIARARGVDPDAVSRAMKMVADAWAGGEVMLQFIPPLGARREEYLAMDGIDEAFQAPAGLPLLPLF